MKKYYTQLMTFILGSFFTYFFYKASKEFNFQGGIREVLQSVLSYPIIVKDSNPITVGKILLGVSLLIVGNSASHFLSSQLAKKILPRLNLDVGAIAAIKNLTFYILSVIFSLFALNMANVPLTAFTFVGGALAIGVGFGSQNLMSNFISGIILQIERPIKVGDTVEIEGSRGIISNIGARRTTVLSSSGVTFILPNSLFLDKKVSNFTFSDKKIRSEVKIIAPIGLNLDRLKSKLELKMSEIPQILKTPNPQLMFIDYIEAGTGVVLSLYYWISLSEDVSKTQIESTVRYLAYDLILEEKKKLSLL